MTLSTPECDREKKNGIHTLLLYITEKCNCKCSHCYMGKRLDAPHEFSFEKFVATAQYFRGKGAKHIIFLGGEPTLYPHLIEAVKEASDMGYEMIRIFTNGQFSSSLLDRLDHGIVDLLLFSLDGSNPEIDSLIRGKGSFDVTVNNIKEAIKKGFRVSITNTVHRYNLNDTKSIISLSENMGVDMVNFNLFTQNGYGKGKTDWEIPPLEWIQFCERLESYANRTNLNFRYPPFYVTPEKLKIYYEEGYRGCVGRLKDRISLFPDGRLYICPLFYDSDAGFATYNENSIVKQTKRCELDFFNENLYSECLVCTFNTYCSGGCSALPEISERFDCNGWIKGKDTEYIPICMFWRRLIKK